MDFSSFLQLNTPDLRVGTLDSLLSLSDDLLKSNTFVEGVSHKIRHQIEELERISGVQSGALTVDGLPVDSYLTRFVWDEAKYPTMSPLREIVDGIPVQVAEIEDDLKFISNFPEGSGAEGPTNEGQQMTEMSDCWKLHVRVAEYNNVHSQLNAINRKQTGSLVKPGDIVTSEHLATLLAVVSKYSQKDWLSHYETLTTYVVPRSSKKLHEDNEFVIFSIVVRPKTVGKQELERLMQDQETMRNSPLQWCYAIASYGEVFSSWMHFCAVRLFTESILRYGLPPSFLAAVLAPSVTSEKKVRSILEGLCSSVNSTYWKSEDEVGMAGLGGDADTHLYVSFTLSFI